MGANVSGMKPEFDLLRLIEEFGAQEGMTIEYVDHDFTGYNLNWQSSGGRFCQLALGCSFSSVTCSTRLMARVERDQFWTPWEGFPFATIVEIEGMTNALEVLQDARSAGEQFAELLVEDGQVDVHRALVGMGSKTGLTRYVAALALSAVRPDVTITGLAYYLEHEDPVVRSHVAWLVGQRGSVRDKARLARLRSDANPYVRGTVQRVLS